jgi:hypothetical protein
MVYWDFLEGTVMKTSNPKTAFPVLLIAFIVILLFGGRFAVIGQLLNNGLAIVQESTGAGGYLKTIEGPLSQQNKMHWPQMPDFGLTGLDVEMTQYPLADDFKCIATGPISDIHFWASFANDVLPPGGPNSLTLELSIYSDVPVDSIKWSRPGEKLWSRTFNPREYSVRKIDNRPLGWYNPWTQNYIPTNHRGAWQYDFYITDKPFTQQEGTIYWLVIKEVDRPANANYKIGWKTTTKKLGWNDAAVYYYSLPGGYFVWLPMNYPARHEYAEQKLHLAFAITDVNNSYWQHDLGDAPDSSNSFPGLSMLAYPPDVNGHFPTVYQIGSPPYGPIHWQPKARYYLGKDVTFESEADFGPDQDPDNNLEPSAGLSDRDGADDGLHLPVYMPNYAATTLSVDATIVNPLNATNPAYLNVWCDWNRDGDWDDTMTSPDGNSVPEWAVQNYVVTSNSTGLKTLTTPAFLCWHPQANLPGPLWVRVSLAEQPWQSIPGAAMFGGDGPAAGYQYGETEDYFVYPRLNQEKPADWGDAPDDEAVPGYPTLSSHNGARHVIAGPWLGDVNDAPDSETNGLPDANALGDDKNNRDDEGGVTIPPLIPGYPADVVLEVGGGGGVVQAWFDFDANAVWSSSEQVFNSFLPAGMHTISFVVPANAVPGQSFARFRISKAGGLGPAGIAPNGEVEDYEISIKPPLKDTKWIQLPDVTPAGVDICIDSNDGIFRTIADDFNCTSTDLLTDVHLWGSWKKDIIGAITKIHLSIHPDDPAGQAGADPDNKYSKPGPEILWQDSFLPGQFLQSLYHVVRKPGQWWWDPVKNEIVAGANRKLWRIDIYIDPNKAFKQEGTFEKPKIYWLDVSIDTKDGQFGWKSRRWPEHFMDDAVQDINDLPREWDELRFPKTNLYHDIEQNSVDMAFQLTYSQEPNLPTMRPVSATQCPVVATQCPATLSVCPPVPTQCTAVSTQCPAVDTQCPMVSTQCPATLSVCPPVPTQCTAVDTQCPAVDTQCPTSSTKCPAVSTQCPAETTKCPPAQTKCPQTPTECKVIETVCPAVETQCPLSSTKCPAVSTQCPVYETRCPLQLSVCPPAETQCTPVDTQCPVVDTQCPTTSTRCPVVSTQCPVTASSCPPGQTTQCPVETQCPAVQTQCPLAQTKCPPTLTECQTVTTECPAAETRCPPQLSVCPPVPTQCTPVDTQCPAIDTQCPVSQTKCPPTQTACVVCPITIVGPNCYLTVVGGVCLNGTSAGFGSEDSKASVLIRQFSQCQAIDVICPTVLDSKSGKIKNL